MFEKGLTDWLYVVWCGNTGTRQHARRLVPTANHLPEGHLCSSRHSISLHIVDLRIL